MVWNEYQVVNEGQMKGKQVNQQRLVLIRLNERKGTHPFLSEANVTGIYPPLGIAYLAAAAQKAGFHATILDAHADDLSNLQIAEKVARQGATVVGISATTFNWLSAVDLADKIRTTMPEVKILVGGPHLSIYPKQAMAAGPFDLGVLGEGEKSLVEILGRLSKGESCKDIPGTIQNENGQISFGPTREPLADLDSLPMPTIDLLPLYKYRALTLPSPFVTLVTSRGCPYKCRYCSQVYVGGKYREHSAERVVAEVERAVTRFHAKEIVFFDETFTINKKRLLAVCEGIRRKDLHVKWNVRTRVDLLDEEMMKAMKKAGCHSLHVGVESGTKRVQKLMCKNLDLDQVAENLATAKRLGMETRGYFMIGFPGETLEEIEQTISFSLDLPLDWASFTITTPHPATDIYFEGMKQDRFNGDYWQRYTLGQESKPPGYFTCDQYDKNQLENLLKQAYRRFYLRPEILIPKLANPRLWKEIPGILNTLLAIGR